MKYVYEFIGTFFLMFTVGMTVMDPNKAGLFAPIAIGSILAIMVYAGGYVSGGHYNPAVSLAVFLRRKLSLNDLCFYWVVQLLGAVVAAFATIYLKGEANSAPLAPDHFKALISEFIFTFALCFVVLNVATARGTAGNSYFGWAIGFTVAVGAYSVGTISGGAFNPAVAVGLSILNLSHWANFWVFIIGNFLGAIVAALIFNATNPDHEVVEVKSVRD